MVRLQVWLCVNKTETPAVHPRGNVAIAIAVTGKRSQFQAKVIHINMVPMTI